MRSPEPRKVSVPDAEFAGRIAGLAAAPDEIFWQESFLRSAYTRNKPRQEVCGLGGRADKCGRLYGRQVPLNGRTVEELCVENGMEIQGFSMPTSPDMEIFALFEPPATIYIRADLFADCDRYISDSGLSEVLGAFCCKDVVLAHEFFHFLEDRDCRTIFTRTYREPAGLLRRKTALPPLSEIAAMSFAREMLHLPWSPFILDIVMMSMYDMDSALTILRRLEQSAAEQKPFLKERDEAL